MRNVTFLKSKTAKSRQPKNLTGLWGHTYVPDEEIPDGPPRIQYQFEIMREVRHGRYIVQLFSWWDGAPTEIKVMSEAELLGPTVKLYLERDAWVYAYDKQADRRRDEIRMLEGKQ